MIQTWSKEKIVATGKRLNELLPLATKHMMRETDLLEISRWIVVINNANKVLEELRKEYLKR